MRKSLARIRLPLPGGYSRLVANASSMACGYSTCEWHPLLREFHTV